MAEVLRNENIFVTGINSSVRVLYQYKEGIFHKITSADLVSIFNEKIGNEEIHYIPQEIKNRWKILTDNLIDITPVINTLKIKQKRDDTLSNCENDYKKVVKIVKQYV